MANDYRWQCLVCGASNDMASAACSRCAFPARATGRAIAQAQAAHAASLSVAARDAPDGPVAGARGRLAATEAWWDMLASLNPWRRVVGLVGTACVVAGALALKLAWSLAWLGWGVLGLAAGLAISALAFADVRSGDAG